MERRRPSIRLELVLGIWASTIPSVYAGEELRMRLATEFLVTPRPLFPDARMSSVFTTRSKITGYEIHRYGTSLCGTAQHFVDNQCQTCGETTACIGGSQPDAVWVQSKSRDLTWHEVCGEGLAWEYDYDARRPFCATVRSEDAFLIAYRAWQLSDAFIYQISRIDCAFCKQSSTLVKEFSGAYPDFTMFDVHPEFGATDLRGTLTPSSIEGLLFKTTAYGCNKPIFAAPPHERIEEVLAVNIQPLLHWVNATHDESMGYSWRSLTPETLPAQLLGTIDPLVDIAACHEIGTASRDAAMRDYFLRANDADVRTSLETWRDGAEPCCGTQSASCKLHMNATLARVEVCEASADCATVGGVPLDSVECQAEWKRRNVTAYSETQLTHIALQWSGDLSRLSTRDIRQCYVREEALTFARFDGINPRRLCKACDSGGVDIASASVSQLRFEDFAKLGTALTNSCENDLGNATCVAEIDCGDVISCSREDDTTQICLVADGVCESELSQYECEYVFRTYYANAGVDENVRMTIEGFTATSPDAFDPRGCLLLLAINRGAFASTEPLSDGAVRVCRQSADEECANPWHPVAPQLPSSPSAPPAPGTPAGVFPVSPSLSPSPPPDTPSIISPPPPPPSPSFPDFEEPVVTPPPPSPSPTLFTPRCWQTGLPFYDHCDTTNTGLDLSSDDICVHGQTWGTCGVCDILGGASGCTSDDDCNVNDGCGCQSAQQKSFGMCIAHQPYSGYSKGCGVSADGSYVCLNPTLAKQCVCVDTATQLQAMNQLYTSLDIPTLSDAAKDYNYWQNWASLIGT